MALTPQPLMRAQDTVATTYLQPVVPRNWKVHANKVNFGSDANSNDAKPRYNSADYSGGAKGDDVTQNTRNEAIAQPSGDANTTPLGPLTQNAKATALGVPFVQDVGRNRGWIAPGQPYAAPPASPAQDPTLTTLTPATAVAGAATPQLVIKLTGTKFTIYSTVQMAGTTVPSGVCAYISPTEIRCQMSPAASVAGTTSITVTDHGITTAAKTFTWT